MYAEKGTVAFGAGLQGWAFTLNQFASRYAKKFGVKKEVLMPKLWGDNFFNPKTKKWTTKHTTEDGKELERAFNMFCLDPIYRIVKAVEDFKKDELFGMLDKLEVKLSSDEKELTGKQLLKVVLRK